MNDAINRKTYGKGAVIFSEGDIAAGAFLVEQGSVEIRKNIDGSDVVLGKVEMGGIFGEMSLIDDAPRMAGAIATEETSLMVISKQTFTQKMESSDPFIRALLRIFTQNIRATARAKREGGNLSASGSGSNSSVTDVSWMLEC